MCSSVLRIKFPKKPNTIIIIHKKIIYGVQCAVNTGAICNNVSVAGFDSKQRLTMYHCRNVARPLQFHATKTMKTINNWTDVIDLKSKHSHILHACYMINHINATKTVMTLKVGKDCPVLTSTRQADSCLVKWLELPSKLCNTRICGLI